MRFRTALAGVLMIAGLAAGCRSGGGLQDGAAWRKADAERDAHTRRTVLALPDSARAALARADAATAVAESLIAAGDRVTARATLERQLAIRTRWLGPEHDRTAASASALARTCLALGDIARATALDRAALAARRKVLGNHHPEVAESLDQLALDLKTAGGSRDESMTLYREALDLRRTLLGPDSREAIETLANIGNLYRVRREADSALAVFQRVLDASGGGDAIARERAANTRFAMAMTVAPLGQWSRAEQWLGASVADLRGMDAGHRLTLARALGAQGLALRHLGRLPEAEAALLESVTLFEQERREAPPGWSRAVSVPLVSYELLAAVEVEQGRGEDAWRSIERGLARSLVEDLSAAGALDTAGFWSGALVRVQSSVPSDAAMIGWLALRPGASTEEYPFWCWCIRRHGPVTWIRVDAPPGTPVPPADLALDRLRRELVRSASWPLGMPDDPAIRRLAEGAWRLRFAPLEPALRGVRRLIVVSPDLLHGTPLEAMRDQAGTPLGDRFTISYAPSALLHAASVRRERSRDPARWRALLVGDGADRGSPSLRTLPMAGEEIRELAARIPSSTVLAARGSPARLDRLARSDSLAGYQLLHFATHANVTDTWVGETALVLDGAGDSAAGRITTADITRRWRLDADLVTLSACETMVGPASKTEGFLGLEQALLAVGARRLLVSAWRVDDRATGMLMSRFYRNLLDPRAGPASEADALAEARHWLRSWTAADGSRPYAHPVYWAGFVLIEGGIAGRRPPHAGDDPR